MKLIWTPTALERIDEISDFIAEDNARAAHKWVQSIFQSVERLKKFPKSGRPLYELDRMDLREVLKGNYRIIYKIHKNQIIILTVRHLKRILLRREMAHAKDIYIADDPIVGLT